MNVTVGTTLTPRAWAAAMTPERADDVHPPHVAPERVSDPSDRAAIRKYAIVETRSYRIEASDSLVSSQYGRKPRTSLVRPFGSDPPGPTDCTPTGAAS